MILVWLALLNGLLLFPSLALPGASPLISLEALVIWAMLCGLHDQSLRYRITLVLAVMVGLLSFLVLADAVIRESLGRGLNLYLEAGLLDATWNLLDTNLGTLLAALALALLLGCLLALGWLFHFGLERLRHHSRDTLVNHSG